MKSRNNEKGVGGRLQQLWVKTARTVPKRGMPERRCSGTRRQELLISQQIDVGLRLATSARRTLLPVHGALKWSFTGHLLVHGAPLHQQLFGVVKHLACQSLGFRTSQPLVPGLFVFRSRHHHQPYRVHRRATAGHDAGTRQLRQCGARVKWIVFVCEQCVNGFSARQFATDVKAQQSRAHGRCRGSGWLPRQAL